MLARLLFRPLPLELPDFTVLRILARFTPQVLHCSFLALQPAERSLVSSNLHLVHWFLTSFTMNNGSCLTSFVVLFASDVSCCCILSSYAIANLKASYGSPFVSVQSRSYKDLLFIFCINASIMRLSVCSQNSNFAPCPSMRVRIDAESPCSSVFLQTVCNVLVFDCDVS